MSVEGVRPEVEEPFAANVALDPFPVVEEHTGFAVDFARRMGGGHAV